MIFRRAARTAGRNPPIKPISDENPSDVTTIGADGTMIEAAAKAGAKGIVSAGKGAGRPTPGEDAAFDQCFKETGMLMCLCSRVAAGRVVRSPGLQQRMIDTY